MSYRLATLNTKLTLCLLEKESPLSDSGILVLDPRTWKEATESCLQLGATLWGSESGPETIQSGSDYLAYLGKYAPGQRFWTASKHQKPSTLSTNGQLQTSSADKRLPVLCKQTAPYSNSTFQDTSEQWRVTVESHSQRFTG